jgi:hypothetical protein
MKLKWVFSIGCLVAASVVFMADCQGQLISGNGATGFGGTVGNGTINFTNDGTTLNATFTRGGGNLNDAVVLYIDSVAGGFNNTSSFTDFGDPLRTAITGNSGSVANFVSGFSADYAIAFDQGFGGLWQLVSGGSHNFISSVGLSPTDNPSSATHAFSVNMSSFGINPGDSFRLVGTYIATSGFRSNEAFGDIGNVPSNPGNSSPITFTNSFMITAVPEPNAIALVGLCGLVVAGCTQRRRKN